MQFRGDHPGTGSDQWRGERPAAGPEVHDEVAGMDTCCCHDAAGSSRVKRVVAPPPCVGRGGHDAP